MSACCVIPARYDSSRFPGKPLAEINGKPMIYHVMDSCISAVGAENTIVATDDSRIVEAVTEYGGRVIMTKPECQTGSDRVAEAALLLDYDVIIDVQGDEPCIKPEDLIKVINFKRVKHDSVINCYAYENEGENTDTIKVVTHGAGNDELIYMSRRAIPTSTRIFKRQVCVYGYYREQLLRMFGLGKPRGVIEQQEDIHILRCFHYRQPVFMVKLKGKYQSVDRECDVKKVEDILNG